jgi:glycosyltransferase involved in cell wall biosynthesis
MHLQQLVARLDPANCDPVILCLGPDVYTGFFQERGRTDVMVRAVAEPTVTFGDFRHLFAQLQAAAIVFVNGKLDLFPWWAYAAARLSGARRVVGLEHLQAVPPTQAVKGTDLVSSLRRIVDWRARYLLARRMVGHLSHMTIGVSHAVCRSLIGEFGYPESRTVTIHNGIDTNHYRRSATQRSAVRARLGVSEGESLLVCIARLTPLKRLDILLEALALLYSTHPRVRCIVVGSGQLEGILKEQARTLGLSHCMTFAGHQDDVRPFLEAADVYVSSSEREGFGLGLAEAMAFELPCVATRIGGHDEVLSAPGTGLLVPSGDPDQLAAAVAYLLDHRPQANAMGMAARRAVEERFDVNRMVGQIQAVLLGSG